MLGKLFKHEFKNTGKILLPLNLVLIGVTLFGMIVLGLKTFSNNHMSFLAVAMLLFYIFGIIALFIITYVFLMVRFYRSMYSSEGYLTHTLPVSPIATLNVKLAVSVFWSFLSMLLTFASILCLIYTSLRTYSGSLDLAAAFSEFEKSTGYSIASIIGWGLLLTFLSSLSGLLMIYVSISIGQLFNKYKILASIITYIVLCIIIQIISTIIMMATSMHNLTDTAMISSSSSTFNITKFYGSVFGSSMIQTAVLVVIFYSITAYISCKKVNLD